MSSPLVASAAHCSCCHSCHVSMKQRPRPLLACSECNNIYCQVCLETRFKTDKWSEGREQASWQCPKCAGDCCCKSCSKGRPGSSSASRKRSSPFASSSSAASSDDEYAQQDDEDVSLLFFAPSRPAPARRAAVPAAPAVAVGLPCRQPVLPAGFQWSVPPAPVVSGAAPVVAAVSAKERMLGIWDVSTPVHRKALELARQKEHCDATIANMEGLLAMLQKERQVLDAALTDLIKQTTSQVGAGLARTASFAQFEDLLLSPGKGGMRKSPSQCNLEAVEQLDKPAVGF